MSNAIAMVAGFFLMIGSLALLIGAIIFIAGGVHPLLVPAVSIAGIVVMTSTIIGLFDKRVFRHAVTWLGVW
jgi:hypothetical protein